VGTSCKRDEHKTPPLIRTTSSFPAFGAFGAFGHPLCYLQWVYKTYPISENQFGVIGCPVLPAPRSAPPGFPSVVSQIRKIHWVSSSVVSQSGGRGGAGEWRSSRVGVQFSGVARWQSGKIHWVSNSVPIQFLQFSSSPVPHSSSQFLLLLKLDTHNICAGSHRFAGHKAFQ
jgi:hypothetical protein